MTINETNYVDKAEAVILALKNGTGKADRNEQKKSPKLVTTSQLRNLLAMTADIYNQILNEPGESLTPEVRERIEYLRVRFLYEAGRNDEVKALVETADILKLLREIQNKRQNFLLFNRYMEALVAFHRYHGGKD